MIHLFAEKSVISIFMNLTFFADKEIILTTFIFFQVSVLTFYLIRESKENICFVFTASYMHY